ncbi:MAG: hypothetical protein ACT4PL_07290, partial [Phycisphaerales bacterium]
TFGVVNLSDRPALSYAEDPASTTRAGAAADLSAALPRSIAPVVGVLPAGPGTDAARMRVRVGGRVMDRAVVAAPVAAGPGVGLGPLKSDLTMPAWLAACSATTNDPLPGAGASAPSAAEPGWSSAATLLRRTIGPSDAPAPGLREWVLYIESTRLDEALTDPSAHDSPAPADEVRVWLGPYSGADRPPVVVLTIPERGPCTMVDPQGVVTTIDVERVTRPGRWSAWVLIPARAIDREQRLRIGLERTDPRGVHTGWPRAMMPFQTEPARAVIDLSSW